MVLFLRPGRLTFKANRLDAGGTELANLATVGAYRFTDVLVSAS